MSHRQDWSFCSYAVLLLFLAVFAGTTASAQEEAAVEAAEPPPVPATIRLKDGSQFKAHIVDMVDGKLKLKLTGGDEIIVQWGEVAALQSQADTTLRLKDDSVQKGRVGFGADGELVIRSESVNGEMVVNVENVAAINPPPAKAIAHRGFLNVGATVDDGNTDGKELNVNGEYIARGKDQRLTVRAAYFYSEENGDLTERQGRGLIKYDLFLTDDFFVFGSAQLEKDEFEDVELRTALTAGPGYQFIDPGELESEYLNKMELYAQAGIAFFSENFEDAEDEQYAAAHWGVTFDWPITPLGFTLFHTHQGFPGLEDGDDIYVQSRQGIRFAMWQGLVATIQVNWEWDNTPQPGNDRSDTKYLLTLGYAFEF